MYFEIIGEITEIEIIAVGSSIRDIARLREQYGRGRWRKLKGVAMFGYLMTGYDRLKFTGMRPTASEKESLKSRDF